MLTKFAFFDFDDTLIHGDSGGKLLKYYLKRHPLSVFRLLKVVYHYALYLLKIEPLNKAKSAWLYPLDYMNDQEIEKFYQEELEPCYYLNVIEELKKIGTISQIKEKTDLIQMSSKTEYWDRATFFDIENVRLELRNLIKFIENPPRKIWSVDIEDTVIVDEEQKNINRDNFEDYRKKVKKFLEGNMDNLVIYKIKHNQVLTEAEKEDLERIMFEELGNNKDFVDTFGDSNVVQVVRKLVGLDRETANKIFSKYINDNRLNSKQIQFIKQLKEYLIVNGIISLEKLKEQPFSTIGAVSDIFKDNINTFNEIKEDIEIINKNVIKFA